jgi:transposase
MDMWKPFRNVTNERAPQAAILFDKFHIMRHLGKALDEVRKSEYRRLSGQDRSYIKGQKYTLLSRRDNLTLDGKKALKKYPRSSKASTVVHPVTGDHMLFDVRGEAVSQTARRAGLGS